MNLLKTSLLAGTICLPECYFFQLPNQVCKTLTFSSNPPHDTVMFTFRAQHFFLPDLCRANAASLICARLKPSKINSNNALKTKSSKIRLNHIISLGFLCSLGDYPVTPETSAEETANNCNYSMKIYHVLVGKELWPMSPVLGDSCRAGQQRATHVCQQMPKVGLLLSCSPFLCPCANASYLSAMAGSFWLSVSEDIVSNNCGSSQASFVFQM